MTTAAKQRARERAVGHALARSALYELLSQALAYPSREAVAALRDVDLPLAQEAASDLPVPTAPLLTAFRERLEAMSVAELQAEHGRVFSHTMSPDCPPCETFYTARHIFQETEELSDIGGFFRAFGLEMAERERLDHISVELEFMHFLSYKEAYALEHHGRAKARICHDAQHKFMQDHLGRWARQFARRLGKKAGGYYGCVASLADVFISGDIEFLGAQPQAADADPRARLERAQDFTCPVAEECPQTGSGGSYAQQC